MEQEEALVRLRGYLRDGVIMGHHIGHALCDMFGVIVHDRHTAGGDASLTAQVFPRLFKLAVRHGRTTLSRIAEPSVEATG